MQGAILAHGVAPQEVEGFARVVTEFAIAMDDGRGMRLQVSANGFLGFAEQRRDAIERELADQPLTPDET